MKWINGWILIKWITYGEIRVSWLMSITYFQSNLLLTQDSLQQWGSNWKGKNSHPSIIHQGISSVTLTYIILSNTNQVTYSSFTNRDYKKNLNNVYHSVLRPYHQIIWLFLEFIREFLSWTHTHKRFAISKLTKGPKYSGMLNKCLCIQTWCLNYNDDLVTTQYNYVMNKMLILYFNFNGN